LLLSSFAITFINVVSHVTIRLAVGHFLWVFHCDHVSILHRYGDMAPRMLDGRTDARTNARVILYSVQCNALHLALDRQQCHGLAIWLPVLSVWVSRQTVIRSTNHIRNGRVSSTYRVFTRSSKLPAKFQQTSSWLDGTPPLI